MIYDGYLTESEKEDLRTSKDIAEKEIAEINDSIYRLNSLLANKGLSSDRRDAIKQKIKLWDRVIESLMKELGEIEYQLNDQYRNENW